MDFNTAKAAVAAILACLMFTVSASAETKSFFGGGTPPDLPVQADGPPELPKPDGPPDLPTLSYYIGVGGAKIGPLDQAGLTARAKAGELNANTLVWTNGMADWEKASTRGDLTAVLKTKSDVVVPSFDAKSFVVGRWKSSGSLMMEGLGMARIEGEEVYTADGRYSSNLTMVVDNPPAQFVQAGVSPLKLSASLTGTYKIQSVADRNFSIAFDLNMTMRDQHGLGIKSSETMQDSSAVIAIDDNTIKNATEDLIARRIN